MKQFETELQKLNLYLINMADSVSGNIIQAVNAILIVTLMSSSMMI